MSRKNTPLMAVRLCQSVCPLTLVWLVSTSVTFGQIQNGNFEDGTAPWHIHSGNYPPGCDPPARVYDGVWRNHYVWIGDDPRTAQATGCDMAGVSQSFDCESGSNYCSVSFKYQFRQLHVDDEAFVLFMYDGQWKARALPPLVGYWKREWLSVDGCGDGRWINFGVRTLGSGGVISTLLIDDVHSQCSANDETTVWQDAAVSEDEWNALLDAPLTSGGDLDIPWPMVPAVSEWGLVALTLLVLAAGTVVIRRRRMTAA